MSVARAMEPVTVRRSAFMHMLNTRRVYCVCTHFIPSASFNIYNSWYSNVQLDSDLRYLFLCVIGVYRQVLPTAVITVCWRVRALLSVWQGLIHSAPHPLSFSLQLPSEDSVSVFCPMKLVIYVLFSLMISQKNPLYCMQTHNYSSKIAVILVHFSVKNIMWPLTPSHTPVICVKILFNISLPW